MVSKPDRERRSSRYEDSFGSTVVLSSFYSSTRSFTRFGFGSPLWLVFWLFGGLYRILRYWIALEGFVGVLGVDFRSFGALLVSVDFSRRRCRSFGQFKALKALVEALAASTVLFGCSLACFLTWLEWNSPCRLGRLALVGLCLVVGLSGSSRRDFTRAFDRFFVSVERTRFLYPISGRFSALSSRYFFRCFLSTFRVFPEQSSRRNFRSSVVHVVADSVVALSD